MSENGLPRWNLEPLFPDIDSPEFSSDKGELLELLANLKQLFELHRVGQADPRRDGFAFTEVTGAYNELLEKARPLTAYLYLRLAVDAADRPAAAALSEIEGELLELDRLRPRLISWLAGFPDDFTAGDYALLLAESRELAAHLMSEPEETLAAELALSGGRAWSKLYGNVSSRITVELDGEELPITAVRNLAHDRSEEKRCAAFEAEISAWRRHEDELAACLNGVKGESLTLARRRGWPDALEPTLQENRISRRALEAMTAAVEGSLPVWRSYFTAKARRLGKERLDWWDLFAPLGESRKWSWEEARSFISEQLGEFSPQAAALAERAFRERWIDAEPRRGKRGGAFCASVGGGASRILANYGGSFDAVSTLAHELGHAYHNLRLASRPPLLRRTPMTLAETASIMNETVITSAALQRLSGPERLAVLDTWLQGAAQVVVDIHSRFLFESSVFKLRSRRELSPEELSGLMEKAQRKAYGEALGATHPYMWAVKPHYYGSDFYNYPYTFGLLFGLGLYSLYRRDPQGFRPRYDALLADTGLARPQELVGRFGFDIEKESFWELGLGLLSEQVEEFLATQAGAT